MMDAHVACRSLGFNGASSFQRGQAHPNMNAVFTLDNVDCTGNEKSLLECPHDKDNNCGAYEHVYLTCEVGKYLYDYNYIIIARVSIV